MTDQPTPHSTLDLKAPWLWVATWFGAGLLKQAPGTWGSLAAIPPALLIHHLWAEPGIIVGIVLVILLGLWAAQKFDQSTGGHDHKAIVIDEVAGQWVTLLPVFFLYDLNPGMIAAGFILFRFFDILKPWPICYLDRHLHGAKGVMADDLLAGLFAAACIEVMHYTDLLTYVYKFVDIIGMDTVL